MQIQSHLFVSSQQIAASAGVAHETVLAALLQIDPDGLHRLILGDGEIEMPPMLALALLMALSPAKRLEYARALLAAYEGLLP